MRQDRFGTEIRFGLLDILFVAAFLLFFGWSVLSDHRMHLTLGTIANNTGSTAKALSAHEKESLEKDGEVKGELDFLRQQNVQIIEYLKKQKPR